jgi:membrane protease subunit HflC
MRNKLALVGLVVLTLYVANSSVLFVDQTEAVYVTRFGEHVATYDGAADAGLHFKLPWPIDSALRLDRRLQVLDVPTQEILIRAEKEGEAKPDPEKPQQAKPLPLTFDVYICWRLAEGKGGSDAIDKFVRVFGSMERAQVYLRSQAISRLKAETSDVAFTQVVNTKPSEIIVQEMQRNLLKRPYQGDAGDKTLISLEDRARAFGIEIVDIQVRRFNHPVSVRREIFAKITEEQRGLAETFKRQGAEEAQREVARGTEESRRINTEAEAEKRRLESEAQSGAVEEFKRAQREAAQVYEMQAHLDFYRSWFGDGKTQLILSLDHPLLKWFKEMPK